jgi:hypothetical protein
MKRNIWAYVWPVGLLLVLGPRSFSWRRRVWGRWLPVLEIHPVAVGFRSWVVLAFQNPRTWLLVRRVQLCYWLGLPPPRVATRGRLEA